MTDLSAEIQRRQAATSAPSTPQGMTGYTYTADTMLVTASGGASFAWDPLNRLYRQGASGTVLRYADQDAVMELDTAGNVRRRFVPGDGADEPLLVYEGSGTGNGTGDRRWLHPDERGSVIAVSRANGSADLLAYDDYGIPGANNAAANTRFGYTGQTWLPEIGAWHYKARIYSPTLGRFLQTDPIGYGDGMNLYGYVGGDPVNRTDPSGRAAQTTPGDGCNFSVAQADEVQVCGSGGGGGGYFFPPMWFAPEPPRDFNFGDGGVAPAEPQSPKPITCATKLPNGRTVGSYVNEAVDQIEANNGPGSGATSAMEFYDAVNSNRPIDFKNNFRGQAGSMGGAIFLAAAGNFAYGAIARQYIGSGAITGQVMFAGASFYAARHGKANTFPSGSLFPTDASAAAQAGRGFNAGCR